MTVLVTGGAGLIGSHYILDWLAQSDEAIVNLDKLTYAGNVENLAGLQGDGRHVFTQGDIGDTALVARMLSQYRPRAVVFGELRRVDSTVLQLVEVVGPDGALVLAVYEMEQQGDGSWRIAGCVLYSVDRRAT